MYNERLPISSEVLEHANRLADMAQNIASRTHGKLQPVMTQSPPTATASEKKQEREWPPLFAELRSKLWVIENAFISIEEALSRTEL